VIFPFWHRLVDLHEREIRALRAHGIPIEIQKAAFYEAMNRVMRYLHQAHIRALPHGIPLEIQKAAFEEAMNRVVRSTVAGVAEVSAESWRASAQKSSKALVVYRALPAQMSSQNLQPELNQSPARRAAYRVVEIWNSNSRDKAVTPYTSRTGGVARLWKASQLLEGVMEPSDAEGPRPAKPAKRTPAMKAKAAKKAAPTKKARDKRSARSNKKTEVIAIDERA
jgi:hypothetical protein